SAARRVCGLGGGAQGRAVCVFLDPDDGSIWRIYTRCEESGVRRGSAANTEHFSPFTPVYSRLGLVPLRPHEQTDGRDPAVRVAAFGLLAAPPISTINHPSIAAG